MHKLLITMIIYLLRVQRKSALRNKGRQVALHFSCLFCLPSFSLHSPSLPSLFQYNNSTVILQVPVYRLSEGLSESIIAKFRSKMSLCDIITYRSEKFLHISF